MKSYETLTVGQIVEEKVSRFMVIYSIRSGIRKEIIPLVGIISFLYGNLFAG